MYQQYRLPASLFIYSMYALCWVTAAHPVGGWGIKHRNCMKAWNMITAVGSIQERMTVASIWRFLVFQKRNGYSKKSWKTNGEVAFKWDHYLETLVRKSCWLFAKTGGLNLHTSVCEDFKRDRSTLISFCFCWKVASAEAGYCRNIFFK